MPSETRSTISTKISHEKLLKMLKTFRFLNIYFNWDYDSCRVVPTAFYSSTSTTFKQPQIFYNKNLSTKFK